MPPCSPQNSLSKTDSFDSYEDASPSGVTEVNEGVNILGRSVTFGWDLADDSLSTDSHLNLVTKSLLSEFDAVSTTCSSMGTTIRSSGSMVQLHRSNESKERKQSSCTSDGGLCVTASVALVLAIWLRETDFVSMSEQQFFVTLMVLPPLVTLLETKLPHRLQETSLALGILVGGTMMQRVIAK